MRAFVVVAISVSLIGCGASVRWISRTPGGDTPSVRVKDRTLAIAVGSRWARLPEGAATSVRFRVVVVRPNGACPAEPVARTEVSGTDGAVTYDARCETVELLGQLAPAPALLDKAPRPMEVSHSSFTTYAVRAFELSGPCTVEDRCRIHWSAAVGLVGADDVQAEYDWREDEPTLGELGCMLDTGGATPAGTYCTTTWK